MARDNKRGGGKSAAPAPAPVRIPCGRRGAIAAALAASRAAGDADSSETPSAPVPDDETLTTTFGPVEGLLPDAEQE